MSKAIECWSFLVSRNLYLGYRTVVAPDFICDAKMTSLIARSAGGDVTKSGTAICRQIINSGLGDLTLVFQVRESTYKDMGMEGDGSVKDSFGREIRLIEGFIFKENPDILSKFNLTQNIFDSIHHNLKPSYRQFWESDKPQPAIQSESFSIQSETEGEFLTLTRQEAYQANPSEFPNQLKQPLSTSINRDNNSLWISESPQSFKSEIISVVFSVDENSLIIRCDENKKQSVLLCSLTGGKNQVFTGETIPIGDHPTPAVISDNGEYVATAMIGSLDVNFIKVWNINTKKKTEFEISRIPGIAWHNRVNAVAFINNEILISGGEDNTIYFWDIQSQGDLGKLPEHSGSIKTITSNLKNNIFASGDSKGTIIIWELNSTATSATVKHKIPQAHGTPNESPIKSLAFSPNGKILASAGDDCQIKFWNSSTGQKTCDLGQHSTFINTLVFSPDGKLLASGDDDGIIKIWDVTTRRSIPPLKEHKDAVTSLSFSPNGKTLVSGSKDKTIRLWTQGQN